jgi:hypothetical protein
MPALHTRMGRAHTLETAFANRDDRDTAGNFKDMLARSWDS